MDTQSYWTRDKRGSTAEVDFVYQTHGKVIPIEVKSGANSHLRSLQSFMANDGAPMFGVRVWPGEYSVNDVNIVGTQSTYRLVNIPFYLVGQIDKIVSELI
jgi:predicted AAA+ superfamily ATPase